MKDLLLKNLSEGSYFKDQKIEGSNWNTLIDQVSITFGMLMFYLNKTASESSFTQAQLFDAMSNVVSILNYKPVGYQSAALTFKATTTTLSENIYTIPRFSFIQQGDIPYSFIKDTTFSVEADETDYIHSLSDNNFLLQGKFEEYPTQIAVGEDFEVVYLVNKNEKNNVYVDYYNIYVFIKPQGETTWQEWTRTESLYAQQQEATVYEVLFNAKQNYEIKFGNGINGKKLGQGDQVKIIYLRSNMQNGEVGANSLTGSTLKRYTSSIFNQIQQDVQDTTQWMSDVDLQKLSFNNEFESTKSAVPETVDDIRTNVPKLTKYKNFTKPYIESYIETKYKNMISSSKVVSNNEFITGHLKYLNDLGRTYDGRILQAQINFSSNAAFNNIYIYVQPNVEILRSGGQPNFVNLAQKKYIRDGLEEIRVPTAEMILMDPVYYVYDFGITEGVNDTIFKTLAESKIVIIADKILRRNQESIKQDFKDIVNNFFSYENNSLGQTIDYQGLILALNNIQGVSKIYTVRNGKIFEGISLVGRSLQYPQEDYSFHISDHTLPYYKFPVFDSEQFTNRIFVDYNEDSAYLTN